MGSGKIGQIMGGGATARLRKAAKENDRLSDAIRGSLPDWIDFGSISYERLPEKKALCIRAPHGQARQLKAVLPKIKQDLRPLGIERVRVEVSAR